jgi:hypothetical protein
MTWTTAFSWTVVVELAVVFVLAPRARRTRATADSILANLATHPAAWTRSSSSWSRPGSNAS